MGNDYIEDCIVVWNHSETTAAGIVEECGRASRLPVQSRLYVPSTSVTTPSNTRDSTTQPRVQQVWTTTRTCIQAKMKRKRSSHGGGATRKKARHAVDQSSNATPSSATHPVLQRLYPQVFYLRHYLLSRLPSSSTTRRRRISQLGHKTATQDTNPTHDLDSDVAQLLDSVLVGTLVDPGADKQAHIDEERDQDIEAFTQQRSQCTPSGTFKPGYFMQTEVGCVTQVAFFPNRLLSTSRLLTV